MTDYATAKEYEFKQDQISPPQMQRIRWDLKPLADAFPQKAVAEIASSASEFVREVGV